MKKLYCKYINMMKKVKKSGNVSWTWRGKRYSGTLIPSKEDTNNRYARTKNGNIKVLPKRPKMICPKGKKVCKCKLINN